MDPGCCNPSYNRTEKNHTRKLAPYLPFLRSARFCAADVTCGCTYCSDDGGSSFHLVSWSLHVLPITCSPIKKGGRTHQCLTLCEKFGAGPYWARSCRLLLKLSVTFEVATSVQLSPSTSLSPLVSDILQQWIVIFPFCPAEPETLIFVFSSHQILWESQVVFFLFPQDIYSTNWLPREAENNYFQLYLSALWWQ